MDTPTGLLVPNVKDVRAKSLLEIAAELERLRSTNVALSECVRLLQKEKAEEALKTENEMRTLQAENDGLREALSAAQEKIVCLEAAIRALPAA